MDAARVSVITEPAPELTNYRQNKLSLTDSNILPEEWPEVYTAINYCSNLADNWNGCGAKRPSQSSINAAKFFMERLCFIGKRYPDKISPDGEGGIVLKWMNEESMLLLTFETNVIHMASEKVGASPLFKDDIVYDGQSIPELVKREIPLRC